MGTRGKVAGALGLVALLVGCGGPREKAVSPAQAKAPVFVACTKGPSTTPLVVGLPAEERSELELALKKKQLAIVRYDCHHWALLEDCVIEGEYRYTALTRREQMLRIGDDPELAANFGLGASALAAQLGESRWQGNTLDLALASVGRKASVVRDVLRSELKGQCEGATHFIRSAFVGAFALDQAPASSRRTVEQLLDRHLSPGTPVSVVEVRDGSLAACLQSPADAVEAPAGCAAPLRVEVRGLLEAPAPASAGEASEGLFAVSCPAGTKPDDLGKCVSGSGAPTTCAFEETPDCELQCSRGSMGSCAILARSLHVGRGVPPDMERALSLYERACTADVAPACARLGEVLLAKGQRERGQQLLLRACSAGWAQGCNLAAAEAVKGSTGSRPSELFRRSCAAGDAEGCFSLGLLFHAGADVPKNETEATLHLKLACEGGARLGCSTYAAALEAGKGVVAADPAAAVAVLERACDRGHSSSCGELAQRYFLGKGVAQNATLAGQLLERACDGNDPGSCVVAGARYQMGLGVTKDLAKAERLFTRGCDAGIAASCKQAQELRP